MCESKLYSWTCTSLPKVFWTVSYMLSSEYLFNCSRHGKNVFFITWIKYFNLRKSAPPQQKSLSSTTYMCSMKFIKQQRDIYKLIKTLKMTSTFAPPTIHSVFLCLRRNKRPSEKTTFHPCLCLSDGTWDHWSEWTIFSSSFQANSRSKENGATGRLGMRSHGAHPSSFRDSIISTEGPEALPISAHHWHDRP